MLNPFSKNPWARCPVFPPATVMGGLGLPASKQPSFIVGDRIEGTQSGVSAINGSVQLDQGDRRISTEHMSYDSNTGLATMDKGLTYASPDMVLQSTGGGVYDTQAGSGTFKDTNFLMPRRHGHGTAGIFNALDDDHSQLYGTTYTTCPPGNEDWLLSMPDMYLDSETNTGEGHDVTIHFLGVPIFWSPYLNFPLNDQRKSGFLNANFSFDVINGFQISAPYYFNLADNYDATLFPRIITKRGVQTGAEVRWLDAIDEGSVYGDYLPHDQVADRERSQFVLSDTADLNEFNQVTTLYNWVSDDLYFRDLGSDLTINSTTILPRRVQYNYDDEADWIARTQFEDFQTIGIGIPRQAFPYRRLPQMTVNWSNNEDATGPQYSFYAEGVRFQRALRVGTWRSDVKPSISLPFGDAGAYFTPTLAWRLTDYDLSADGYAKSNGQQVTFSDRHLSRSLPIFDIDTGLNFERDYGRYTQTVEPRLFYLRVPYRDQSQIPIFDTVAPEFGYMQLFSDNRFYGGDRQSDANQLSYALTTRFLDSLTGAQVFQADIGQARYFADRRVQQPGVPVDTSKFSDVVGDMLYNFNDMWTADYNQLWNPVTRETDLASVLLQYHPAYHQVVNLGYEFRRPNLKQTTVSFAWPLAGAWSWVGGWNYDVVNHATLERIFGFEYDNCCWNFQILNRFYEMPNGKYDSVIFFSLQLKGLGQVGHHLESILQRDILGYTNNEFDVPLQQEEQPAPP
ncbi:MAG TPA: LPS assembly protein LptD [Gammaproteobacteria bacterium]|nr:LPS assembly protein LptD [Gammaproteobacteria bacterium]